ncbi:MAG: hypothetical protein AAF985_02370 [Bacteroidota bacterium]
MIILAYTKFSHRNIKENLGKSEYSYYFVLRKFLPVLKTIGEVHLIENPLEDISKYSQQAEEQGKKCVVLAFTAPHHLNLDCPPLTIPVFAWEYDTIPNESWDNNEKNNWVTMLRKAGAAITHSEHSAEAIRKELGHDFPMLVCPAPIDEKYLSALSERPQKNILKKYELQLTEKVIDSQALKLAPLESPKGFAKRIELTHVLLQTWAHYVL